MPLEEHSAEKQRKRRGFRMSSTVFTSKECNTPENLVTLYYKAVETADLDLLKTLMTRESYMLTLESYAFKMILKDSNFKTLLDRYDEDTSAKKEVEQTISEDLLRHIKHHDIVLGEIEHRGENRICIHYTEDNKNKKLFFSQRDEMWKIDYMAGRIK